MIVIAFILAGVVFGIWRARRNNGNRLDMAQFAFTFALIFGVIGLFLVIMIERMN